MSSERTIQMKFIGMTIIALFFSSCFKEDVFKGQSCSYSKEDILGYWLDVIPYPTNDTSSGAGMKFHRELEFYSDNTFNYIYTSFGVDSLPIEDTSSWHFKSGTFDIDSDIIELLVYQSISANQTSDTTVLDTFKVDGRSLFETKYSDIKLCIKKNSLSLSYHNVLLGLPLHSTNTYIRQ